MQQTLPIRLVAVGALAFFASTARAGGIEYTGQGAQSLARGGAVAARAEDPMVLAHNPAGLVELRGSQFLLDLNLALFHACVEPAGYYGWGAYLGGLPSRFRDPETGKTETLPLGQIDQSGSAPRAAETDYYTDPYDTVCLDQTLTTVPQLAWTRRVSEDFGVGFGLIFPPVQPSGHWGGEAGVIRGDDGELRPAATRYMQLGSNNLGAFPTLGAAVRLSQRLRVGAALEWGMIAVNNFTMASTVGGTTPANDIIAHVKAQDWFVPAFTVSTHLVPVDAVDLVFAFRFQDDLNAHGDIDLTTGVFDPTATPRRTSGIPITSLHQGMPWKLRAGIRYADRFAPRPAGDGRDEADAASHDVIHDPLQDERWDVELDGEYQLNSRNDKQLLDYEVGHQIVFETAGTHMTNTSDFPNQDVPNTVIEKYWKDQVSLRLGSTVNLLPGVVGVSGGVHYETRGVNPDYMQIDFWPVERVGLHAGVIVRVAGSIDVELSYAHIFQETIVVGAPPHGAREDIDAERIATGRITAIDKTVGVLLDRAGTGTQVLEEKSQGTGDGQAKLDQNVSRVVGDQPPWIVNSGTYRSDFDVLAAGFTFHY